MRIIWIVALLLTSTVLTANIAAAGDLLLRGATVLPGPGETAIDAADVLIMDGRIDAVAAAGTLAGGEGIPEIDVAGKFVVAGFWNSHVHFLVELAPAGNDELVEQFINEQLLAWGFTSVIDTGSYLPSTLKIRQAIEAGEMSGPRILTMNGSFVPVGGSPFYIDPVKLPELTTVDQAAALGEEFLNAGADGIKLFTGSWATANRVVLMEAGHIRSVTDVAHQRDTQVFAHPSNSAGARLAIENGVDVLAHTFPAELDGPWDRSLPGAMVERGVALVPTLKLFRFDLERIGLPAHIVDLLEQNAVTQTAAVSKLGGVILFGTDVGYMSDASTGDEYRLMARAGMDFDAVLTSLTTAPAKMFGVVDMSGRVASKFEGDLVVLNSDPRKSVEAFADVAMTIRGGNVVYRSERF